MDRRAPTGPPSTVRADRGRSTPICRARPADSPDAAPLRPALDTAIRDIATHLGRRLTIPVYLSMNKTQQEDLDTGEPDPDVHLSLREDVRQQRRETGRLHDPRQPARDERRVHRPRPGGLPGPRGDALLPRGQVRRGVRSGPSVAAGGYPDLGADGAGRRRHPGHLLLAQYLKLDRHRCSGARTTRSASTPSSPIPAWTCGSASTR